MGKAERATGYLTSWLLTRSSTSAATAQRGSEGFLVPRAISGHRNRPKELPCPLHMTFFHTSVPEACSRTLKPHGLPGQPRRLWTASDTWQGSLVAGVAFRLCRSVHCLG